MDITYAPKPDGQADPASIRREGSVLDEGRFDRVAAEVRRHFGVTTHGEQD